MTTEFENRCGVARVPAVAKAAYGAMLVFASDLFCHHKEWGEISEEDRDKYIDRVVRIGNGTPLHSLFPQSPVLGIFDDTVVAMMRRIGVL